jgi:hypothetical protein
VDNNEAKVDVLLQPSSEPIASLGVLEDACLAGLTARIWETCRWPDAPGRCAIGDYRFAIRRIRAGARRAVVRPALSEPREPVLIEVSSGHSTPGALKYVWRAQRKLLEQRGFAVGGAPRNFQKETVVDSPDGAEALASETLGDLFRCLWLSRRTAADHDAAPRVAVGTAAGSRVADARGLRQDRRAARVPCLNDHR